MTKTASEMIFSKYYIMYGETSDTYFVFQESGPSDLIMAEYTDRHAAEYICEQLNRHAALEAPK